jgi:cell division protein FtsQ
MDFRALLAQAPKPKVKQGRAARLHSHAWHARSWHTSAPRWQRRARRWSALLLEFKLPRGVGSSAAAMLVLASASYGAVKGGHVPVIVEQVQDAGDQAANALGFRISEIALAGQHEIGREEILTLAGITGHSSLLLLDAARTRDRLLANPWIAEATVLKLYPGRLRIDIKEREAFALWQKDGRVSLIATDGTVLEPYVPDRFSGLPRLIGAGAEHAGKEFLALVARYPEFAQAIDNSVLVAQRRWNLHLKGGVEVLLPEDGPERALSVLRDMEQSKKLLERDIVAIDLRRPDRVTVRLSDAAAAVRAEAVKAAEKARKGKGKGGEA